MKNFTIVMEEIKWQKKPVQQAVPTEAETDAHVDDLVNKALKALEEFEDFTQEQVDYIVAKCSVAD